MPHPLSRVKPDAEISIGKFNDFPIMRHQHLAVMAAAVISTWSNVELHMLDTYVNLSGGSDELAAAIFLSLESHSAKSSAINTLALAKLDHKMQELLRAIQAVTKSHQGQRDKIAHWVWGDSPSLPDAILLIDPRQLVKASTNINKILDAQIRGDEVVLPEIDRSKVFVYKMPDFIAAAENNCRVATYWIKFESIMYGRITDARGERYAELCSQPEIADRVRRQDERD